jgi:hypothetical protein
MKNKPYGGGADSLTALCVACGGEFPWARRTLMDETGRVRVAGFRRGGIPSPPTGSAVHHYHVYICGILVVDGKQACP